MFYGSSEKKALLIGHSGKHNSALQLSMGVYNVNPIA